MFENDTTKKLTGEANNMAKSFLFIYFVKFFKFRCWTINFLLETFYASLFSNNHSMQQIYWKQRKGFIEITEIKLEIIWKASIKKSSLKVVHCCCLSSHCLLIWIKRVNYFRLYFTNVFVYKWTNTIYPILNTQYKTTKFVWDVR